MSVIIGKDDDLAAMSATGINDILWLRKNDPGVSIVILSVTAVICLRLAYESQADCYCGNPTYYFYFLIHHWSP